MEADRLLEELLNLSRRQARLLEEIRDLVEELRSAASAASSETVEARRILDQYPPL